MSLWKKGGHFKLLALGTGTSQTSVLGRLLYSAWRFRRPLGSFRRGRSLCSLLSSWSVAQQQSRQSKRQVLKLFQRLLGAKLIYSRWWNKVKNTSIESRHDGAKESSQWNSWTVYGHATPWRGALRSLRGNEEKPGAKAEHRAWP